MRRHIHNPATILVAILLAGVTSLADTTSPEAETSSPPPTKTEQETLDATRQQKLLEAKKLPLPRGFENIHLYMPLSKFVKTRKNLFNMVAEEGENPRVIDANAVELRVAEEIDKHPFVVQAQYAFEWDGSLTAIVLGGELKKHTPQGARHEFLEQLIALYGAPAQFDVIHYGAGQKWAFKCAGMQWKKKGFDVFAFVFPPEKGKQFVLACIQSDIAAEYAEDYNKALKVTESEKKQLLAPLRAVVNQLVARQKIKPVARR